MNLVDRYRQWARQWPEAARWAPLLWLAVAACAVWGAWTFFRGDGAAEKSAQNQAGWVELARSAAARFPDDPVLWREAGRRLLAVDPLSGRRLLDLAADAGAPASANPATAEDRAESEAGWLLVQERPAEAASYLDGLPAALAGARGLRSLRAAALCRMDDGERLRSELLQGAWGPAEPSALDLALAARGLAERGRADLGREVWAAAITACGARAPAEEAILRVAIHAGLREQARRSFEALLAENPSDATLRARFARWKGAGP